MKKILICGLALLVLGTALFADDAKVMPARVGRIYFAPTFGFANGAFDKDGDYEEFDTDNGSMKFFNMGFALEYGIIEWITAALQWAPGWNAWSKIEMGAPVDTNLNGVADLFLGAKLQIIGGQAPVQNDLVRLALAPGVKIPLPGPDYEEEAINMGKGDPVTVANIDKHVLGIGGRFYFDYVISDSFFINLYSEFIGYPVKGDLEKNGFTGYMAAGMAEYGLQASTAAMSGGLYTAGSIKAIDEIKTNYGYDLTFELEPVFSTSLAQTTTLTAGLPFNFKLNPAQKNEVTLTKDFAGLLNGFMPGAADMAVETTEDSLKQAFGEDPSYTFTVKPNVSVFFMGWALPTEFKLQYSIPVAGKLNQALHAITLQAKLYFKI